MHEDALGLADKIKQECFKCHPHAAFEALAIAAADIMILQLDKKDHARVAGDLAENILSILRMSKIANAANSREIYAMFGATPPAQGNEK